jgi:hypothetical protein
MVAKELKRVKRLVERINKVWHTAWTATCGCQTTLTLCRKRPTVAENSETATCSCQCTESSLREGGGGGQRDLVTKKKTRTNPRNPPRGYGFLAGGKIPTRTRRSRTRGRGKCRQPVPATRTGYVTRDFPYLKSNQTVTH